MSRRRAGIGAVLASALGVVIWIGLDQRPTLWRRVLYSRTRVQARLRRRPRLWSGVGVRSLLQEHLPLRRSLKLR